MKKIIIAIAAGAMTLSMAACNTPGERAIGGAATGRGSGALAGAAIGAAGGAIVGAGTAPARPSCPYGYYQDAAGNLYCR
jgi:osmotically inducible lipoprotein OsmB